MKNKIYLLMFIMIFLVSTISALELDNVKSYNTQTKTITIKNAFGLPLIGSDIATAQLNTPQLYQVQVGEKVKIARFTINPYTDYSNLISGIEITNMKSGKQIDREIIVKYWGLEDYSFNFKDCTNKTQQGCFISNKTEQRNAWINWDKNAYANKQVIVELYMDMGYEETFDWKPTIAGVKVNEWAVVTSGDVTTYQDIGGVNYTTVTYINNGTFNTTSTINASILVVAGGGGGGSGYYGGGGGAGGLIYNNAYDISGNNIITIGAGGIGSSSTSVKGANGGNSSIGTQIAWGGGGAGSRANVDGANGGSGGGGSQAGAGALGGNSTNSLQGYGGGNTTNAEGTQSSSGGGGASQVGENSNVDGTNFGGDGGAGIGYTIYNGTTLYYAGGGGGAVDDSIPAGNNGIGGIGGGGAGSFATAGSGINGTGGGGGGYGNNGGTGGRGGSGIVILRYNPIPPSSNPSLILNSPINNLNTTQITITNFSATLTDLNPAGTIKNVTLYVNGVVNQTNTTETINGTYTFSVSFGSPTSNNWSILAYNNNSLSNQSDTRNLYIYNTPEFLDINLTSPTNNSNFTANPIYLLGTIGKTTGLNITNVTLLINNLVNQTISTGVIGLYNFTFNGNNTLNTNTSYYWNIIAYDNNSKLYSSNNGTFKFNLNIPSLAFPVQILNFTNVSLNFNEASFIYNNLNNYWSGMDYPGSVNNYMIFSFYNPNSKQIINITTRVNPFVQLTKQRDGMIMSNISIYTAGITTIFYQEPLWLGVLATEKNETLKIDYWGCNDAGCSPGNNSFYIIVGDIVAPNTIATDGGSFITGLANGLANIFPESDSLSLVQKFGIIFIIILILNIGILGALGSRMEGNTILLLNAIASILTFLFFVSIGYVPGGILYLFFLIIVGFFIIKNKNG